MILNSVKSIIVGTYTAISVFLGTKKIFPSTSSYVSTYYSQSITPAQAITLKYYTALQTVYASEKKTYSTNGTGSITIKHTLSTRGKNTYSTNQIYSTGVSLSSVYTTIISNSSTSGGASTINVTNYTSYIRLGYTYYTRTETRTLTANSLSSTATINTGYHTSGTIIYFRTASGTRQSSYTVQLAATYSRTTNQSTISSRTTTTNGTFVKVQQQSYKTTLTSNV